MPLSHSLLAKPGPSPVGYRYIFFFPRFGNVQVQEDAMLSAHWDNDAAPQKRGPYGDRRRASSCVLSSPSYVRFGHKRRLVFFSLSPSPFPSLLSPALGPSSSTKSGLSRRTQCEPQNRPVLSSPMVGYVPRAQHRALAVLPPLTAQREQNQPAQQHTTVHIVIDFPLSSSCAPQRYRLLARVLPARWQ